MATGRSESAASVVTESRSSPLCSAASRLPAELVTEILEYLPPDQDDIWAAASVSRAFYAAARRARLYIHRNIVWKTVDDCAEDLRTFSEVVQHVLQKDLLLSLSFSAVPEGERNPQKRSAFYASVQPNLVELLSAVTTALPVLVSLELHVGDHCGHFVDDALHHPAPRLRELELSTSSTRGPCSHAVPIDLFVGCAPQLRQIILRNVRVAPDPVPAFSMVTSASFDYEDYFPDIKFLRHFPRLRDLGLVYCRSTRRVLPPPHFQLDGLTLRKLAIEDKEDWPLLPSIERAMNPDDIPIIERSTDEIDWKESLWPQDDRAPLSVRLAHSDKPISEMRIFIVPGHRRWQRNYNMNMESPAFDFSLACMPGLSERVTYLRMDNMYLLSLLECGRLTLDALRAWQVDFEPVGRRATMVWPPDWYARCSRFLGRLDKSGSTFENKRYECIACRNLETLTLFALDEAMCVDSQEAAFLGGALCQTTRPKEERAALVLRGIQLKEPIADSLLDQTYSTVRSYEFSGWDSPADRDGGLWDEDV